MLRILRLAAVGLSTAFAALAQTPPTLGIFLDFGARPASAWLAIMEREVGDLLKPSGVALNWSLVRDNRGDQTFTRLVVVKFKGHCQAERLVQPQAGEPVVWDHLLSLGDTKVLDGRVLPFSEIHCDEVRKALSFLAPAATREQRQAALGIAMARVMAHELYHVLARTATHAAQGLARASHPLQDLISNHAMVFQERDSEAIRQAFAAPPR